MEARAWFKAVEQSNRPAEPDEGVWKPKNPEAIELYFDCCKKRVLPLKPTQAQSEDPGEEFWRNPLVPRHPHPREVFTHVNKREWKCLMEEMKQMKLPGWERQLELAGAVLEQLDNGASSGVSGKGLESINVLNMFKDKEIDPPRILDAILHAVKKGYMAGPFTESEVSTNRVNGFLSAPKPYGERRQCGDLSSPPNLSFNENADPELRNVWVLNQMTAKSFSYKLKRMGKGAIMGKSDLSQAYKNVPVSMDQTKLQWFRFGTRYFVELRLIFGDKYAPMFFDRFHHVLLGAFVLGLNNISWAFVGKCLDDVPITVPKGGENTIRGFFKSYTAVCNRIGVVRSATKCSTKSFEESTKGEILGIEFDSLEMTWKYPERKRLSLLSKLHDMRKDPTDLTTKQWESLTGKLIDLYQLWPTGKIFIDVFIHAEDLVKTNIGIELLKREALIWIGCLESMPHPIVPEIGAPSLDHLKSFSDASGQLNESPSVGILIPAQYGMSPKVASWELPRIGLIKADERGVKLYHKTTTLELVGMLGVLLLAPNIVRGRNVVHVMDNLASTLAWERGRSISDPWATVIVRAIAHICAELDITLFAEWRPRRSSRETVAVDDLSHDCCESLTAEELKSYIEEPMLTFPDPLLAWLKEPRRDHDLGPSLVAWLRKNLAKSK